MIESESNHQQIAPESTPAEGPVFGRPVPGGSSSVPSSASPPVFQRLDPRVIRLWRLSDAIGLGILVMALLVVGIILAAQVEGSIVWVAIAWLAVVSLSVIMTLWHAPRAYAAWGYRIDDRVLEIRSGIWFRVLRLLPLSRLQHVDLHRGPLERACGLASLVLHTAGTHEATLMIPGLDSEEAVRLRDQLLAAGGDDAV